MTFTVRPYTPTDFEDWDAFCAASHQATFLHSRRFLAYHGERFKDHSVILEDAGRWVAVFPAALNPVQPFSVVSHPGLTFGGFVDQGALRGERGVEALTSLCRFYADDGLESLVYKAVPHFYHSVPSEDDLYALFRLGATRTRCDLSSTIDLSNRAVPNERRRRSLKKAIRSGVTVDAGSHYLPSLWTVVTDNLQRKHGTSPVHSIAEITSLAELFPDNIRCVVGMLQGQVIAGLVLFCTRNVVHAQYIASSEIGYDNAALDVVFDHCIANATVSGKRWFDFGISTTDRGRILNDGLYRFKSEFGGGGIVHEFYEIALSGYKNAC